jgi:non-heme chloroperoxidase
MAREVPALLRLSLAVAWCAASSRTVAQPQDLAALKEVSVGRGMVLHYFERGEGEPVVFVHGSLTDGSYWHEEVEYFSKHYRAITYSRRYSFPNLNPIRPGYSAMTDADDLAGLVAALALGKVHVVGHSYGALAALFLAVRHPALVRSLVLAEPPVVSLLQHLHGDRAAIGKRTFADIQARMLRPMQRSFRNGDEEAGVRAFMAYAFNEPLAWDRMTDSARRETFKNVREWDAILPTGVLFPALEPGSIKDIRSPALLLSGQRSYPFLALIDGELELLLRSGRRTVVAGAGHQMWLEKPDTCRGEVLAFWRELEQPRGEHSE